MSKTPTMIVGGERPRATRQRISGAIGWGFALAVATKIVSIVLSLVLVRLVAPEAYGQFGLANAVLMFAMAFSMQRFMEHTFHAADASAPNYAEPAGGLRARFEEMNAAKPCVACRDGGAEVLVEGETGLLVGQPINQLELVDTLAQLTRTVRGRWAFRAGPV
jgi:hypothetical protein